MGVVFDHKAVTSCRIVEGRPACALQGRAAKGKAGTAYAAEPAASRAFLFMLYSTSALAKPMADSTIMAMKQLM